MTEEYTLKIDAYAHIVPAKYIKALEKLYPKAAQIFANAPALYDEEHRFRVMDRYESIVQVISLDWPAINQFIKLDHAVELAKLANDEMAELVSRYPDRFVAAIACLPLNNIDAALKEADRAISKLKFRGIEVGSNINDKPLDLPEFMQLYEKMSEYDLPIYIHPERTADFADYRTEDKSKYSINSVFGWPWETTVAMARIVFSGILEKYPKLKFITHHCGGMVPYYAERIIQHHNKYESMGGGYKEGLSKPPIQYFKMFYNDTAIHGNTAALMCAYDFWGAGHLLFAADVPHADAQHGFTTYRKTINAIAKMGISDEEKKQIFEDNARDLMRLLI